MVNLNTNIGSLIIKNPVIAASGTCGYGVELIDILDINKLGAISVKGLHINPKRGNSPTRIFETPCGMLNAIGLQGIGINAFKKDKMPILRNFDTHIILNFWGRTQNEYEEALYLLNDFEEGDISALELNVSCPNIKEGGITFGTDPKALAKLVNSLAKKTSLPLIVKLSPNVTSIATMAKIAQDNGADAISLINTFPAMAIDINKKKPILSNVTGGLSGPAIKPIALKMLWDAYCAVDIPLIGIGGIMCANDALEFIIAGASAVQIGTANFIDPFATLNILNGIYDYCNDKSISDIKSLIGSLEV